MQDIKWFTFQFPFWFWYSFLIVIIIIKHKQVQPSGSGADEFSHCGSKRERFPSRLDALKRLKRTPGKSWSRERTYGGSSNGWVGLLSVGLLPYVYVCKSETLMEGGKDGEQEHCWGDGELLPGYILYRAGPDWCNKIRHFMLCSQSMNNDQHFAIATSSKLSKQKNKLSPSWQKFLVHWHHSWPTTKSLRAQLSLIKLIISFTYSSFNLI